MNFRPRKDVAQEEAFQMTAMVDVVFILLAFFVLASEFRSVERDFAMGYEQSGPRTEGLAPGDLPPHIPVYLRRTDKGVGIRIAQAVLRDDDFDAIRAKLTEINVPSIGVRILADPQLTVEQVARAIDAVLGSPMKQVSVSEDSPPRSTAAGFPELTVASIHWESVTSGG